MKKKINFFEYKTVINNFFNLAFVQFANLVLQLITVPYVIRIVGIDNVGLVAFATSLMNYFGVIINYGFNLTATKAIAQNGQDLGTINQVFCNVTYTKFFLTVISLILFVILSLFVVDIQQKFSVYVYLLFSVIFTQLAPEWFFQGVQKLKFYTNVNLCLKFLATALTFLLIRNKEDYYYLAVIPFLNGLLFFLITQIYIQKKYKLIYRKIHFKIIFQELYTGRFIFLSQVKITFFSNFNVVVLGFLTNTTIVGIFSSADKVVKIVSSVQIPLVSALFPHFSHKIKENRIRAFTEIKKIAFYGSLIYSFALFILFVSANLVAELMFGTHIKEIAMLIRIMCVIPLFVFLNNLFGTQYLLNTANEKVFLKNLIIAAILNSILIFPLTYFFNATGTSLSVAITELFVFLSMYKSAERINNFSLKIIN